MAQQAEGFPSVAIKDIAGSGINIGLVANGMSVRILQCQGDFVQVEYAGTIGWAKAANFKESEALDDGAAPAVFRSRVSLIDWLASVGPTSPEVSDTGKDIDGHWASR